MHLRIRKVRRNYSILRKIFFAYNKEDIMDRKTIVTRISLLAGLAALSGLAVWSAPARAADSLSKGDQQILSELAQANLAEINAGKIAEQKASSPEVKTFAQKMVDDHTKGLQEVQQVAQSKNMTLPTEPDKKHQALADKLNSLSGTAFDRAYLSRAGVGDHKAAHKLLAQADKRAKDPDVKALVEKLQPVVDQHLSTVRTLAQDKGVTPSTSGGNTDNPTDKNH